MQGQLTELSHIDLSEPTLPRGVELDGDVSDGLCRWAVGRQSTLSLPCPKVDADLVLMLTVDPFCCVGKPDQVLRVSVGGTTIRVAQFSERAVIVCRLPQALTAGRERLELLLDHPEPMRPDAISHSTDGRPLSVGFLRIDIASWREGTATTIAPPAGPRSIPARRPVEELTDERLMHSFASLGDNCEFGTAQRVAGAEPLDLLRFVGMPYEDLLAGLSSGFRGVDRLDDFEFIVLETGGRREYILHQRRFAMHSHTNVDEGQMTAVHLLRRERRKLEAQARLFRVDMADAQRIFVYKRNAVGDAETVMPLVQRLREWGPNTLLHVVHADASHPPGHVEIVADGLLRGYIDRFNRYDDAAAPPSQAWNTLCRNSYTLWCKQGVPR